MKIHIVRSQIFALQYIKKEETLNYEKFLNDTPTNHQFFFLFFSFALDIITVPVI